MSLGLVYWFSISCNTIEPYDPAVNKPQPEDSKSLSINIDKSFDFKNFRAHTLVDSANLDNPREKLYAPTETSSPLIFTDNATGDVMALVHLDPNKSEIEINAETVAKAFMELLPAYPSLNEGDKTKFWEASKGVKAYTDLLISIGNQLKSRESIYSDKPEHLSKIIALNEYLVSTYLEKKALPGARTAGVQENFSNWVTSANGASIFNQVSSFVHVEFIPIGQGSKISKLLEPKEIFEDPSALPISELKVPDNCYTVNLSQDKEEAKSANIYAIAQGATALIFNAVFGTISGGSRNDCIAKIAGSLTTSVTGTVLESANSNDGVLAILTGTFEASKSAVLTNFTDIICARYFTSKWIIYRAMVKNLFLVGKIYESISALKSGSEMVPFAKALLDGVELSEVLQLYNGNLIQACVEGKNVSVFNEIYSKGSIIYPTVKMVSKSEFGPWNKSGFKVDWKTSIPNGGTVNLPSSSTNSSGEATVEWTLPTNYSGEVQLIAEIKDKESDHLFGSPIKFTTKVTQTDSIQFYSEKVIGSWTANSIDGSSVTSTYQLKLYENGKGRYIIKGPNGANRDGIDENGDSYYDVDWKIIKVGDGFYLSEDGFWHFGFEAYRSFAPSLENARLKYPISFFLTYNDFGQGPYASRKYTKN